MCAAPLSAADDAPFGMLDSCLGLWCYDEMLMRIIAKIAIRKIDRSQGGLQEKNRAQRCPMLYLESALIGKRGFLSQSLFSYSHYVLD